MFYSQHVLTRKGPLAKIWLAAHMQSKLTKAMVFATDLRHAIETILHPPAPMALRLTSNLLLGVARILHRKTKYLLQESADALTKLKLTFRPATSVDLPASSAPNFAAVTLADASVDGLAAPMVDLSLIPRGKSGGGGSTSAFLAADRDITIDEFAGGLAGGMLDAFGMGDELEMDREGGWDADAGNEPLLFTPSQRVGSARKASVREAPEGGERLGMEGITPASVEVMRAEGEEGEAADDAPVLSVGKEDVEKDDSRESEGMMDMDAVEGAEREGEGEKTPVVREGEAIADVDVARGDGGEEVTPPQLGTPEVAEGPLSADARLSVGEPLSLGTPPALETPPKVDSRPAEEDGDALMETPAALPAAEADEGQGESPDAPMLDVGATPEVASAPRLSTGSVGFQLTAVEEAAEEAEEEEAQAEMRELADGVDEPIDSPAPAKRGRKRKRVLIEDPATELTVEAFRAILTDTSDLVYGPNERRRGGERIRRAPLAFEELLARPAMVVAPELSELFAMSFRLDDTGEVGSPMSDADLGKDKAAEEEDLEKEEDGNAKERERDEEEGDRTNGVGQESREKGEEIQPLDNTPEKPPELSPVKSDIAEAASSPSTPKVPKPVVADPFAHDQQQEETAEIVGMSQNAPPSTPKPTPAVAEDEISPDGRDDMEQIPTSQVAESSTAVRRLSFPTEDPAAIPQPEEPEPLNGSDLFDPDKISLRDVANTRSQVAEGDDDDTEQDVTETTVSARTRKMQEYIREHVDEEGELDFSRGLEMEPDMSRRTAARAFYELLNLSSKKALLLRQDVAYGRIMAEPVQPAFDNLTKMGTA